MLTVGAVIDETDLWLDGIGWEGWDDNRQIHRVSDRTPGGRGLNLMEALSFMDDLLVSGFGIPDDPAAAEAAVQQVAQLTEGTTVPGASPYG